MRALVTGATGFVGRHVCAALAARGHEVVAVTSPRSREGHPIELRDGPKVAELFAELRPAVVFHLAGRVQPGPLEDSRTLLEANAAVTQSVCEAVRQRASGARVVLVSSGAVYGDVPRERNPVSEAEPLRPVRPYGVSKAAAETVAIAYRGSGIDVAIARVFNLAGPGQPNWLVPACFAEQVARLEGAGPGALETGNLEAVRDFVDVRDAARALVLLADAGAGAGVGPLNVCSGVARSIRSVVDDLLHLAGLGEVVVRPRPGSGQADEVPYQCGSRAAIGRAVGWEPAIPWLETLGEVLGEWRTRVRGETAA